jgi:hypothetical protein
MERFLLFIKHHLNFVWKIIELINGVIFWILFMKRMERALAESLASVVDNIYRFRKLTKNDLGSLHNLIYSQESADLTYFNPHGFDIASLGRQLQNPSFLMMGAFDKEKLAGYFFLRFFSNRKCFVGRLIDKPYRGKGIGLVMNRIMYETAWKMGFRCLSTISKNNSLVMKAHSGNKSMVVLKELPGDYLLVEFLKK